MNEFICLTEKITISVKQEGRGMIAACTYRCPEQQLGIHNFE